MEEKERKVAKADGSIAIPAGKTKRQEEKSAALVAEVPGKRELSIHLVAQPPALVGRKATTGKRVRQAKRASSSFSKKRNYLIYGS